MARQQPAAKSGKKQKPAPAVVAAPVSIVRRGANVLPKVKVKPPTPKVQKHPAPATQTTSQPVQRESDLASTPEQRAALSGYSRDNPQCLAGEALRQLAHERGMSRSEVDSMTDDKVREQVRYRLSAIYDEA